MSADPPPRPTGPESAPPARLAPSRDALLAVHQFPGEFIIKAFGPGTDDFEARAVACARAELGAERVAFSSRDTRSGTRRCVTLTLQAEKVEQVEAVYERLHHLSELFLIL